MVTCPLWPAAANDAELQEEDLTTFPLSPAAANDSELPFSSTDSVPEEMGPSFNPPLTPDEQQKPQKRETKAKTDPKAECLVCHTIVNRMDRHFFKHSEVLNKNQQEFVLDFFRIRNAHKVKTI